MNSSAAAEASGPTVLEPSVMIDPVSAAELEPEPEPEPEVDVEVVSVDDCPPHAPRASVPTKARPAARPMRVEVM